MIHYFKIQKKCKITSCTLVVEGEGFEPSKAVPTDLQSAPFGHSGTPPYKADDRTRTDNLLITSQLLCQLSHVGIFTQFSLGLISTTFFCVVFLHKDKTDSSLHHFTQLSILQMTPRGFEPLLPP